MRQAGHLAAAGLIALQNIGERLQKDHQNAQTLANLLFSIKGIELEPSQIKTNIIFFKLNHPKIEGENFIKQLESRSIKIIQTDPGIFRAVLHREISQEQTQIVAQTIKTILMEN